METDSLVEKPLDSFETGEDINLKENQVKGDNNFNFLKDNTFLNNVRDCSELNLVSEKGVEQNLGTEEQSSSLDEEDNENWEQGTVDDFECKKEDLVEKVEEELIDNSNEIDIFIETNVDLDSYLVDDNLLEAGEKNTDVMQMEDEEGEEVEDSEKAIEEEREEKKEEMEVNREKFSTIENDGKVDNNEKDFGGENGGEEGEEKNIPFDENKGMEEVKKDEAEIEKNVVKEEYDNVNSSFDKVNKVREAHLDENMEEGSLREEEEEEEEDTKKKEEDAEEEEELEKDEDAKKDTNKEEDNIKPFSLCNQNGEETEAEKGEGIIVTFSCDVENKVRYEEEPLIDLEQELECKENFSHDVKHESEYEKGTERSHNRNVDANNEDVSLDENEDEELLLNENKGDDEDMLSLYENQDINEEELLLDGDQKDEELFSLDKNKEKEVLIPDEDLKDGGMLSLNENEDLDKGEEMEKQSISDKYLEDEGNASEEVKKVTQSLKIEGVRSEIENTEIVLRPRPLPDRTCSTPTTQSISQPTTSSNSISCLKPNLTSSCTPSSKFTSRSKPSSKSMSHSTPLSKPTSYCTPAKTLLKYWKPSVFRRSRLFASDTELDKTGVDDTTEKCSPIQEENDDDDDDFDTSLMKLEQKLAEMESEHQSSPNFSKTCSKMEAYHKTIVAEREEDSQKLEEVMAELSSQLSDFQKGLSQDSRDVSEISAIIEEDYDEEDIVMQEFLDGKDDKDDGLMIFEDIDFANEQNDTIIEIKDKDSVPDSSMEDVLRLTCSEISGLNASVDKSGATLSSDVVKSGSASNSDVVKLGSTSSSNFVELGSGSDVELRSTTDSDVFMLESKSSVVSESTSSLNVVKSGSTSSDVSGSTLSSDFVQLVSKTTLNTDVKLVSTSSVVLESTSSSNAVKLGSTSSIVSESTPNPDVILEPTSSVVSKSTSSVVSDSTSSSDVVNSGSTSSADIKAEATSEVSTTTSSADPVQESTSNSEVSSSNVVSTSSEVIEILDDNRSVDFVSDDPLENKDNFHPNWEIWRNLTNDRDRYREISKRWRNMSIPNPNVSLTRHNFLELIRRKASNQIADSTISSGENLSGKRNKKKRNQFNKKRKFQEAFQPTTSFQYQNQEPPAKRQKCTIVTEIFDNEINDLLRKLEGKRYMIHSDLNSELTSMAIRQEREMFDCVYRYNGNHEELQYRQIQEVGRLTNAFQQEMMKAEQETRDLVSMLRMSTDEVKTFHAFYEDLQDDNGESQFITKHQLDELLETEFMVSTYKERYGTSS